MSYNNSVSPIWLRQVATALSSRYNVQIRQGNGWSMDIENRVMTYKPEHLLALDRDTCLGILLHELGHLHFTTSEWSNNSAIFKSMPKIVHNAVNAYEDVRINEKMSQSYMGSRELIEAMNELLAGDGVTRLVDMNRSIINGTRSREGFDMPEWFEVFYISMCKLLGDNLFPQYTPDMYYDEHKMQVINEIVAEADARDLPNMPSTQEVYDFVEQVVFPRIQQWLPQVAPDAQQGNGNTQSQEGEKQEQENENSGNNTSPDKVAPEDAEDAPENEEQAESSGGEVADEQKPEPQKQSKQEGSARGGNNGVGSEHWQKELEQKIKQAIKRGRVNPDEQHRTEPFDKNGQKKQAQRIVQSCNVDTHMSDSVVLQRQFKNKFEVIFRDNQYAREQVGQRSGRLNNRVLYKHRLGNSRLFKKKIVVDKKSYAVGFALDLSSSMSPQQVKGSFQAMLAFTNTLAKLDIKHAVGFFSHECTIGKSFDKPMVNKYMSQQASAINNGGTRPDDLIKGMFGQDLVAQNVKERIAIILTDGMWRWSSYQYLEKLKKDNPSMHIYIVPLMLHPAYHKELDDAVGKVATVLHADTPSQVMDRYIQIARKHII